MQHLSIHPSHPKTTLDHIHILYTKPYLPLSLLTTCATSPPDLSATQPKRQCAAHAHAHRRWRGSLEAAEITDVPRINLSSFSLSLSLSRSLMDRLISITRVTRDRRKSRLSDFPAPNRAHGLVWISLFLIFFMEEVCVCVYFMVKVEDDERICDDLRGIEGEIKRWRDDF